MNKKKMIKLYLKNGVVLPRLNAYEALEKFCKECGQRLEWEE